MSHTPGPWSNERIWDTPASRIHARVDGIPVALAEVFTMRGVGEKEANARLIAAAPDMLDALKDAYSYVLQYGPEHNCAPIVEVIGQAIDKAQGLIQTPNVSDGQS